MPAGKTTRVKIKLSPKALKVIRKRGKLNAKLKATLRDPAGGVRTLTRNVTLKARGRLG